MTATKKHPDVSQEEFEYYTQKHQGKKMIIKVSGGEFSTPEFSQLIETIHLLLENDITIFLVFGGGYQIDACYRKFSETPREKIDGVGVTTATVLEHGVLPAYRSLIQLLEQKFLDMPYSVNVLEPKDLHVLSCIDCEKFGFVANPEKIILDESKNLHIIGFVGEDRVGQKYNVNADEIALAITDQQKIDEVVFITGTGGILDNDGEIVSKISHDELKKMTAGEFPNVSVKEGMQKKCQEILELLKKVPKVAMATSSTLERELFTKKGAGTLCTQ